MPFLGKNVSFLEGTCTKIEQINSKIIIWVFPKNRGVSPKMDGENNGKTLLKLDNLKENPIFGNIHIIITWHLTMFDWEQKHIIFIRVVVKMLVPDLCPYITAIPLGSRFKKIGKSEGFTLNHLFLGSYRFWKKKHPLVNRHQRLLCWAYPSDTPKLCWDPLHSNPITDTPENEHVP